MFAWHGKNLVELDSFFGKITIFSQKFKKTAFKMAPFWGFFVLGGIVVCKMGGNQKEGRFCVF